MKTFKNLFLFLVTVSFFFLFSFTVYAAEDISTTQEEETTSSINGADATPRNCKQLSVREEPSSSSKLIVTIPFGEHFTVIEQIGKWFKIEYQSFSGFVFWKYLSFTEEEITEDSNLIGNSIIHYTSSQNRDTNIRIACETINGIILKPKEEFRWSHIIGQTTVEKGYLEAPVIVNKKTVPGLGGGVCQVSTTIYNALLDTAITPTELHHHSIGSAYAKQDATVAYGSKDFAFVNTYDFPIKVEAYSYKATVFVNLYHVDELEEQ